MSQIEKHLLYLSALYRAPDGLGTNIQKNFFLIQHKNSMLSVLNRIASGDFYEYLGHWCLSRINKNDSKLLENLAPHLELSSGVLL